MSTYHNVFPLSFVKDRTVGVPVGAKTLETPQLPEKNNNENVNQIINKS